MRAIVMRELQARRARRDPDGPWMLVQQNSVAINTIDDRPDLAEQLIRLALLANEASRGIGIRADNLSPV